MDIQLEQFKIFEAVARLGSFSAAAEELFVTQPAVSQSIKLLEGRLETKLFVRGQRGATLTEAGQDLYAYVSEAIRLLENGENHINQLKTLHHGLLRIGASDTLCNHYLLPYLKQFQEKYPHVKLRVTNRTSRETVELLRNGKVDIGFVNTPCAPDGAIEVRELLPLHDIFVYNPKLIELPMTAGKADLSRVTLMMLEKEAATRTYVESEYKKRGITLSPQIELGSHDLLLSFAMSGIGVAAVVREYSRHVLESGELAEIDSLPTLPPRAMALVTNKKTPLTAAAMEFIKMLGHLNE
ncbi:MAG: LysR family transcriptional regulator [Clostridia bacterium]|nr:LysR family transcriptional regulator [Clostridia bacterium]